MLRDANEITIKDIEEFLNSDGSATSTEKQEETPSVEEPNDSKNNEPTKVTETQAFAHRLKSATEKARLEERNNIAKALGYESYEALQKSREEELLKSKGLDPEEVNPIVNELLEKRLKDDPRLQELEGYRQQKMQEWAKKELAELKELTGGEISKMEDVPKDVLELWKTKGSLKAAYLELQGDALIKKIRSGIEGEQSRGSTGHLQSPKGAPAPAPTQEVRPFTEQEKKIYRLFNPEVTDEELSKMTKKI